MYKLSLSSLALGNILKKILYEVSAMGVLAHPKIYFCCCCSKETRYMGDTIQIWFHDLGVLFQPLFLNYFTHIFEYFRQTALIKNWIYNIQLIQICLDNFPFLPNTSQIFSENVQVLVAVSLTCPHPPVDGHLSLHPGPPHNTCRG